MSKGQINYKLRKEFNLNTHWDSKDRDDVTAFNKVLWDKWKRDNHINGCTSVEEIPNFLASIERSSLDGDSPVDIGSRWGLRHQRIEQIFEDYNLISNGHKGSMHRIWSDEKSRFVPITPKDFEPILKETSQRKKDIIRGKKLADVVWTHINTIQDFQREHGRPPYFKELSILLGYSNQTVAVTNIARYWGHDFRNKTNMVTYREAIDNLYRMAGVEKRPKARWKGRGRAGKVAFYQ